MSIRDIQNYIAENQNRYPREVLIEQLRKNGYPEGEIQEVLQGGSRPQWESVVSQSIWVKIGWWALGFVAGGVVFYLGAFFVVIRTFRYSFFERGFFAALLVGVLLDLLLYFWLRKRLLYFARGVLTALIAAIAIVGLLIFIVISIFGGGINLLPFL